MRVEANLEMEFSYYGSKVVKMIIIWLLQIYIMCNMHKGSHQEKNNFFGDLFLIC